jgi:hypothetical protein
MVNGEWVMDHRLRPNALAAIEARRAGDLAVSVRRGREPLAEKSKTRGGTSADGANQTGKGHKADETLFRFTLIALQVYALGRDPAAEDGGFSKNYLSGNLCQQE